MDNNFNSQSDNSSDWKSNSRQKNKSRTGSKSKLSVLTIVLLVTAIASIIANIVLLVTDSKRTADTVARIEDKDIETARNTEKDDMLNLIRSRFESGSSTLSLLKELYPDNIVYVNRSGNYVFADINPKLAASEYDKSAFARNDKGLMTYPGTNAKTYTGIDLSKHNSDVDFAKVKAAGVDFAMIRCGYRAYGSGLLVEDTSFNTYTTNAIKNNIDVGVYFYSQALNKEEAIEEANYVLTLVKPYNITYPIAIDVEAIENDSFRQENLSASELTDVIIAFCDTIGYTPLIYSNLLYFMDNVELERLEGYDKWFAGYQTASPYYPYKYAMWQYTSRAVINGANTGMGYCDLNYYLVDKNYKE